MNEESSEFIKKYHAEMSSFSLPEVLQNQYEIIQCLKDGEDSCTFLAESHLSGMRCVIKWARGKYQELLKQEYIVLLELNEKRFFGIPRPFFFMETETGAYFLREYIDGISLRDYVERNGVLSCRRAAEIGEEICRVVEQFQSMDQPLIHRDVKPENLILDNHGNVILIDFGTVRNFRMESTRDTFVVGTHGTAAPEQYGCRQTDKRTDVYAIGRTLWYLAAGSYQENGLEQAGVSGKFRKIIRKAAAFDPKKRYDTAGELGAALKKCQRDQKGWLAVVGIAVLVCAAGIGGYLYQNRVQNTGEADIEVWKSGEIQTQTVEKETEEKQELMTQQESQANPESMKQHESEESQTPMTQQDSTPTPQPIPTKRLNDPYAGTFTENGYIFCEPLIEQAVREQLDIEDTEPVTQEMLESITSLKIVGEEYFAPEEDLGFSAGRYVYRTEYMEIPKGTICALTDLSHMKHLLELTIGNQEVADLSPLEGLSIHTLNLAYNEIADFSVLASMSCLERLVIAGNPAKDLSCLKECKYLSDLNLDDMGIEDVEFVENLPLKTLSMWITTVKSNDAQPLGSLSELCKLDFSVQGIEDFGFISRMKKLEVLALFFHNDADLGALGTAESLKYLNVWGNLTSLDGIECLPNLVYLFCYSTGNLYDLEVLTQAKNLRELGITGVYITDYSPLFEIPILERVTCREVQAQQILALDPEPDFIVQIE